MADVELLKWVDDGLPDADETVLMFMPDADEQVWPGYYAGDDGWLLADGMPAPKVTKWAPMPTGSAS